MATENPEIQNEFNDLVASFSEAMLNLANRPIEKIKSIKERKDYSPEGIASMSGHLESLSYSASFAASMADLIASFANAMSKINLKK